MEQKSKLYTNFISRPPSKDTPWKNNGAGYKTAITESTADDNTKTLLLKRLNEATSLNWEKCTLHLSSNMYGETYYAAAALVIYQRIYPQNPPIKIFHQLVQGGDSIFKLQQSFLQFLDPTNYQIVDQVPPLPGLVKIWPAVNEFLFPKYIMSSEKGAGDLHTLLKARFITPDLRTRYQTPIETWLRDTKKIQLGLKTVGVWIRSKKSNDLGDDVNNLTQDHYQHIVTILARLGVQQVVLLGDNADYSASPEAFAQSCNLQVVNLIGYFKYAPFVDWVQNAQDLGGSMTCQLLVCDCLKTTFNMKCLIGKKSGGLDGPSMVGVPQIFFESGTSTSRMGFTAFIDPLWTQVPIQESRRVHKQKININDKETYFFPDEANEFERLIKIAFPN